MISYTQDITHHTEDDEIFEVQKQKTDKEMQADLEKAFEEMPARQMVKYNPDFSLMPAYREMVNADTDSMSKTELEKHTAEMIHFKRFGTFTQDKVDAEIEYSLSVPIADTFKMLEKLQAEVLDYENQIDSMDISEFNQYATALNEEYKEKMRGVKGISRATLEAEYNNKFDALQHEYVTVPKNELKVKRWEALQKYKIHDSRAKLYISQNRDAIDKAIEDARNAEIKENLVSLLSYMED